MKYKTYIDWLLRIAVAALFVSHGIMAVQGEADWVGWIVSLFGLAEPAATTLLHLIGFLDLVVSVLVLLWPIHIVLLWATFWGVLVTLLQPLMGEPLGEFLEHWAVWSAPLALFLIHGIPKHWWQWLEVNNKSKRRLGRA